MNVINPPSGSGRGMASSEGRMLFVAGQIGWNAKAEIVSDRFVDQFDQALANVLRSCSRPGARRLGRADDDLRGRQGRVSAAQREIGERYRARMGKHSPR